MKTSQHRSFGPDQRLVIPVPNPDGSESGCIVECRYEGKRFQLFFHSPESCAEGCEPVVDLEFISPADQKKEREEASKAFEEFLTELADLAGSVHILDKHGLRPLNKKKQN